jgi:hypothetical protein
MTRRPGSKDIIILGIVVDRVGSPSQSRGRDLRASNSERPLYAAIVKVKFLTITGITLIGVPLIDGFAEEGRRRLPESSRIVSAPRIPMTKKRRNHHTKTALLNSQASRASRNFTRLRRLVATFGVLELFRISASGRHPWARPRNFTRPRRLVTTFGVLELFRISASGRHPWAFSKRLFGSREDWSMGWSNGEEEEEKVSSPTLAPLNGMVLAQHYFIKRQLSLPKRLWASE